MLNQISGSIVLYNTPHEEVERAIKQFPGHLYIIDNSPAPIDPPVGATYIHTGKNLGYGRAHNIAIRRTTAAFHAVMNTDVWYEAKTIEQLIAPMRLDSTIGLTVPQVSYPDGSRQYLCRLLPTPADLLLRQLAPRLANDDRYELRQWSYGERANIPFVSGCFMMLRTDLAKNLGGFDERFFLYCEDIDLSRRFHAVSQTVYLPEARIIHAYRSRQGRRMKTVLHHAMSAIRYFNKWGWLRDAGRSRFNERALQSLQPHCNFTALMKP